MKDVSMNLDESSIHSNGQHLTGLTLLSCH